MSSPLSFTAVQSKIGPCVLTQYKDKYISLVNIYNIQFLYLFNKDITSGFSLGRFIERSLTTLTIVTMFSLLFVCFTKKNTRLKKFGFHTERFSYIVLRKGERDSAGEYDIV